MVSLQPQFIDLVDWIFPPVCVHCQREGAWLCSEAQRSLQTLEPQTVVLPGCLTYTLGSYDHPVLQAIILGLKYHGWFAMRPVIDQLAAALAAQLRRIPAQAVIIPVPLHPQRLRQRGFNQSLLIAQTLSRQIQRPVVPRLVRHRNTKAQAQLNAAQRQTNVHDAFRQLRLVGEKKYAILVDDVVTTGATLRECATVLRQKGFEKVVGIALAKG